MIAILDYLQRSRLRERSGLTSKSSLHSDSFPPFPLCNGPLVNVFDMNLPAHDHSTFRVSPQRFFMKSRIIRDIFLARAVWAGRKRRKRAGERRRTWQKKTWTLPCWERANSRTAPCTSSVPSSRTRAGAASLSPPRVPLAISKTFTCVCTVPIGNAGTLPSAPK